MTVQRAYIDQNPDTGTFTEFVYDDATDEVSLINGQDMTGIIEANKAALAEPRFRKNGEEFRRVAAIPLSILMELRQSGRALDSEAMKRWLNDPDNRFFRTTNETV